MFYASRPPPREPFMFETMRRLHPRGAANRGVCVDGDGAMLGPDWALVERAAAGYRVAQRGASRDVQKALLIDRDAPDWLFEQGQRIADALNRGEVALAQIYGLRIPAREIDGGQLKRLASIATLTKSGFDPDEPRIPAGQPRGGEWTTGGNGSGGSDNSGASPDSGDISARPSGERAAPPATASRSEEFAPVRAQFFDHQSNDGANNAAPGRGNSDANIVPASYTVAPSRGGRDASSSADESGVAGLEAYLIEAGYNLTPEMWKAVRALYRLYVTPGSTLSSLWSYLAENGLNFDELPSIIRSLFDAPKPLAELQTNKPPAGFYSEAELKRYLGDPPPGYEWHHIIEQNGQFRPDLTSPEGIRTWIQNTANMVMVPVIKHYCINGIMSRKPNGTLTVRT